MVGTFFNQRKIGTPARLAFASANNAARIPKTRCTVWRSAGVQGMNGLRVVDASVMPNVTNGNTNAPTLMIAEKMSDHILGHPPADRIDTPVWEDSDQALAQG